MSDKPKTSGKVSTYTDEVADIICSRLAAGESLRSVCRDEDMPSKTTVFRWLRNEECFRDQYARAKEESADAMMEEILEIADDGINDWMEKVGEDGQSEGWKLHGEHVQRSKLRIDARKWMMSKMKPKKYGDLLKQEISGPDGAPIQTNTVVTPELEKKIAEIKAIQNTLNKPDGIKEK